MSVDLNGAVNNVKTLHNCYGNTTNISINTLNAELNPICHLLALLGSHPILHVSRIRVNTTAEPQNTTDCRQQYKYIEVFMSNVQHI